MAKTYADCHSKEHWQNLELRECTRHDSFIPQVLDDIFNKYTSNDYLQAGSMFVMTGNQKRYPKRSWLQKNWLVRNSHTINQKIAVWHTNKYQLTPSSYLQQKPCLQIVNNLLSIWPPIVPNSTMLDRELVAVIPGIHDAKQSGVVVQTQYSNLI